MAMRFETRIDEISGNAEFTDEKMGEEGRSDKKCETVMMSS